jgi:hypothetical protein
MGCHPVAVITLHENMDTLRWLTIIVWSFNVIMIKTNIRTEYFKVLHNLRSFLFKMPFIS